MNRYDLPGINSALLELWGENKSALKSQTSQILKNVDVLSRFLSRHRSEAGVSEAYREINRLRSKLLAVLNLISDMDTSVQKSSAILTSTIRNSDNG